MFPALFSKVKKRLSHCIRHRTPERLYNLYLLGYNDSRLKRALLSYITHPFSIPPDDPRFFKHIVIFHAQEIIRVLNRMGYVVDVVNYSDTTFVPHKEYDLFIGHAGVNYEKIAHALPHSTRRIYLSNGNYWKFHNEQELARFAALRERRGVDLPLDRFIHHPEEGALLAAEAIIGFGNAFNRQTYVKFPRVFTLNNIVIADDHFERQHKDYEKGRNHFLFFAGPGNVHKGLDLLLEAFQTLEDQHLWICTQIEEAFESVYTISLHHRPNIHLVGLIQPRSPTFYDLMNQCNFSILPSCSEAAGQSVVECMNQGLIPLISRECTLDVGGYGVFIDPCTIDEIIQVVSRVSRFSADQCRGMSLAARREAAANCSEEAFSKNFECALETVLRAKDFSGRDADAN